MSMPATPRENLYNRLTEVLGNHEARTMMDLLPDQPPRDLATRSDVAGLDQRVVGLEQRIVGLDHRMDRFEDRMDRFEESLGKIEKSMERFDDRLHGFHDALRDQTRVFVLACTSAMIGVGALAFAAARFVA